jgi:4-amino-4-deoxy-L-arabinose transferase-like glycosyltransferase
LILGGGLLLQGQRHPGREALFAFLLATLVSLLALAAAIGPNVAYRYSWAFLYPAILALVIHSCSGRMAGRWPRRRLGLAAQVILAVGILVLARYGDPERTLWRELRSIERGVRQSESAGFRGWFGRRYARMQDAVPEGAFLLTRLEYPFVLDFRRHTIFIADYPGGSSPPPGMPFFQGGERLARYLCAQSVRYVAYSYRTEAAFTRDRFGDRLAPGANLWARAQAEHTLDFQANLAELGQNRHRIYDDGDVFVLDLDLSRAGDRLGCAGVPGTSRGAY